MVTIGKIYKVFNFGIIMGNSFENKIESGLEGKYLEGAPKQKSGYLMDVEQIKANAQSMKKNSLDEKIINIAKEAHEEANKRTATSYGKRNYLVGESSIADILGIFGGSVKGINILELGCGNGSTGDGNYIPILSTALAYLGANVTGVDSSYINDEAKSNVYKKCGFHYKNMDISQLWMFDCEDNKKAFENNDLVIARYLLNKGLKCPNAGPFATFDSLEEWNIYGNIIRSIRKLNKKDAVYNLEIPHQNNFKFSMQKIDETNVSDKDKKRLKDDYLVNEFKKSFGEIIFGKESSGSHVFTIKRFDK